MAHVMFALFCAISLIGCCLIYIVDTDNDVDIVLNSDGSVSYAISGFLPEECSYFVLNGTEYIEQLYLYYDETHLSEESFSSVNKFFDTLTKLLENRGFNDVERIDAEGFSDVVSDLTNAKGRAIFSLAGILPDTVKINDANTRMEAWFSAGGTIYWSGSPIGAYRESNGEKVGSMGMLPSDAYNNMLSPYDQVNRGYSDIALNFSYSFDHTYRGLSVDCPNSRVLGLCDKYSSYSVVRMVGNGSLHVFGGDVSSMSTGEVSSLCDMLVCGVGYGTTILEKVDFKKGYGSEERIFDGTLASDSAFYVVVGKPESQKGMCLRP